MPRASGQETPPSPLQRRSHGAVGACLEARHEPFTPINDFLTAARSVANFLAGQLRYHVSSKEGGKMLQSVVHSAVRKIAPLAMGATALGTAFASSPTVASVATLPIPHPLISDWQYLGNSGTPPSDALCNQIPPPFGPRRCFNPTAVANAYNYAGLHAAGNEGQGKTIAIIDSFGSDSIRNDLAVFNTAFGLPHMCGEGPIPSTPAGNCPASAPGPHFNIIEIQGSPPPVPPPPNDNGTGLEFHNLWDLEVSLDVEWSHATAPLANIDLVTTPTAETLGQQGFQQMMHAEDVVVENHMADVITQSFGAGEGSFNNGLPALKQLRQAFIDAQANHVTVFASSGDGGSLNGTKQSIVGPQGGGAGPASNQVIPYPSVIWPASDPLVTAVGGTYLCMDATTGLFLNTTEPPARCQPGLNTNLEREPAWRAGGGGYSIFFQKPDFQSALPALPAGSSYQGSAPGMPVPAGAQMRGVPDIAYQASSLTGMLVYMTEPNAPSSTTGGTPCPGGSPCSTGWYVVGGTSSSSPQWAGLIAMADQMAGRDLGYINPSLYTLANNPTTYANDFFDDDTYGNQQTAPGSGTSGDCCQSSKGWDAVTGLGSPNVANLLPDLIAATP
jgi:subtilase family serine protease